jgi:hypothetical protein
MAASPKAPKADQPMLMNIDIALMATMPPK